MAVSTAFFVILIGAGEINFGSPEGPWNHSARLEEALGPRLHVLSVIDRDVERSRGRIEERQQNSRVPSAWEATEAHSCLQDAKKSLKSAPVHLIILGVPPQVRGTTFAGRDMDSQVVNLFPQARALLLEKPIGAMDPRRGNMGQVSGRLHGWAQQERSVLSVGYMLRYLSAVAKIKQILADNNLVPTCINARYYMAYEQARKLSWWDKEASCRPVVEQATHFVDLIRYIAGADNHVQMTSVRAAAVEHYEEVGQLSKHGIDENDIAPANRVPRATTAFWKHQKGTLGTLCHAITLHGECDLKREWEGRSDLVAMTDRPYDTELEVLADGWIMKLKDAYTSRPRLTILGPNSNTAEVYSVEDDPFLSEIQNIVKAVDIGGDRGGWKDLILSDFCDAIQTYALTWWIREASEDKPTVTKSI